MKNTLGIIVVALLLIGGGLFLINQTETNQVAEETEGLLLATSFYPLEFALERIVGELGTVNNIGAGRDPHDFEPSVQDILTLQRADLVALQGADFEPWGDDIKTQLEADGVIVVLATADIELHEGGHAHDEEEESHTEEDEHAGEEEHGAYDPHTWLDPLLFSVTVDTLTTEIIALDSDNAEMYQANADALKAELLALHTAYTERLARCALDEAITSHDAFGYLGDRYNFKLHSIAGLSTQDIPSALTLAELRAEAEEGIGAILLEENSITTYGETLARETGLDTLSINPIAYVIPAGEDYFSLMQSNLDTFATALNCNE
jgi:zinc transport system substrate-binding protein